MVTSAGVGAGVLLKPLIKLAGAVGLGLAGGLMMAQIARLRRLRATSAALVASAAGGLSLGAECLGETTSPGSCALAPVPLAPAPSPWRVNTTNVQCFEGVALMIVSCPPVKKHS